MPIGLLVLIQGFTQSTNVAIVREGPIKNRVFQKLVNVRFRCSPKARVGRLRQGMGIFQGQGLAQKERRLLK